MISIIDILTLLSMIEWSIYARQLGIGVNNSDMVYTTYIVTNLLPELTVGLDGEGRHQENTGGENETHYEQCSLVQSVFFNYSLLGYTGEDLV